MRRTTSAVVSVVLFVCLNAIAWAAIGAGSFSAYVSLVRRHTVAEEDDAYTLRALLGGGTHPILGAFVTTVVVLGLAVIWWRARHNERTSLAMAIVVSLFASPIVWLHYLVLLVVPVALLQPSLGWLWFVPIATLFCPGYGNGTLPQTALGVAAIAVVALALTAAVARDRDSEASLLAGQPG